MNEAAEKKKILIVEDNPISAEDFKQRLEAMGYAAEGPVTRGENVIQAVTVAMPDLILMDIRLKGSMNGIDAAQKVNTQFEIPVIYLTAHADRDTLARAKKTEPYGYIVKPIDDRELQSAIEIALYKTEVDKKERETRQWFQTTLRSIGDAVIAADTHGCVTFMNPIAEDLTGWSEAEAFGKPITDVFHIVSEDALGVVESPVERILRDGKTAGLTNHTLLVNKAGRQIPIADSGAPIKNDRGQIIGMVLIFRDQTRERSTARALRDSEERYRGVAEDLPILICTYLPGGAISFVNKAYGDYFSMEPEALIGTSFLNLIPDNDRAAVLENIAALTADSPSQSHEHRVVTPAGEIRWQRWTNRALIDEQGNIKEYQSIGEDTTDRKRAEEALRRTSELNKSIIHSSAIGIAIYDSDGDCIDANTAAADMIGANRAQLLSQNYHRLQSWKKSGLYNAAIKAKSENRKLRAEIDIQTTFGNNTYFDVHIIPFRAGTQNHLLVMVDDITKRKKSEDEIRKLSEVVKQSPMYIIITDPDGLIEYVNPAFLTVTGFTPEEVLGRNPQFLKSGQTPKATYTELWETILDGRTWKGEFVNKRKDGSLFWERATISSTRDSKGEIKHFIAIKEDITELKKIEQHIQQAQRTEAIGNLAGGIAHDFNNILTSIIGYTELSLDEVPAGSIIEDNLQEVYTAGKRAKDLVRQILAFARQSDQDLGPVSVHKVATEVIKFIRSTIPTTIEIRAHLNSESTVLGNSSQVHQILMNLCTNAAHAMEEKGGTLEIGLKGVRIDPLSPLSRLNLKPGEYLELTVSDTGVGIPPEMIGSIFDPYVTSKEPGEGTGLGLAVVQGIVESYGGKITVESRLGEGTTFRIYLPVSKKYRSESRFESATLPTGCERILFLDDEETVAILGREILKRLGYSVTMRTSSVEALELFRSKPDDFDLIITDMTMPNMTGDKLAMELMKVRPGVPIILCTGYSKMISEESAREIGIKAFVHKPIVKSELAETIRKVLDEPDGFEPPREEKFS